MGLEGGGTLVGRTPHGGVVSKVIMLLLHTTTLAIPQAKSSYKTTLPPLTLFTLFQQSRLCIYKLSGKVRTLLEWADELLSKNSNGWVMGDTPYGLHCYDYASNDTIWRLYLNFEGSYLHHHRHLMFVPPRLPPLVTENNYSQPLNTQEGGIEQEADTGNSKKLNTRVFYKNTFFEIHIAQCWLQWGNRAKTRFGRT